MDDPMIRPRLDRITERDLWGFPIPSGNPPPISREFPALALRSLRLPMVERASERSKSSSIAQPY